MNHYESVGFPAEPTRVYQDSTRLFPRLMKLDLRLDQQEADKKWRAANQEKYRAAARARMKRNYWKSRGVAP